MLVDHLFQCRISPWPKTAEKRGFRTGVTDRPTDGWTDRQTEGRTDRPSYRDAFLTDASKKKDEYSLCSGSEIQKAKEKEDEEEEKGEVEEEKKEKERSRKGRKLRESHEIHGVAGSKGETIIGVGIETDDDELGIAVKFVHMMTYMTVCQLVCTDVRYDGWSM